MSFQYSSDNPGLFPSSRVKQVNRGVTEQGDEGVDRADKEIYCEDKGYTHN